MQRSDWRRAPIELPEGAVELAVGDVHGHRAQLDALLAAMSEASGGAGTITFLGDLVDRGPDSLGALTRAAGPAEAIGFRERHLLLGNHEILMLLALGLGAEPGEGRGQDRSQGQDQSRGRGRTRGPSGAEARDLWVVNGGGGTLAEAGLTADALESGPDAAAAAFRERLGAAAFDALASAPLARAAGNLLFVHAGIDPEREAWSFIDGATRLSVDSEYHPAWIRWDFLRHETRFRSGLIVVHGHTPEPRVLTWKGRPKPAGTHELDHWRLGLDGGSYATGIVAGAEFRRGEYRVFTARGAARG